MYNAENNPVYLAIQNLNSALGASFKGTHVGESFDGSVVEKSQNSRVEKSIHTLNPGDFPCHDQEQSAGGVYDIHFEDNSGRETARLFRVIIKKALPNEDWVKCARAYGEPYAPKKYKYKQKPDHGHVSIPITDDIPAGLAGIFARKVNEIADYVRGNKFQRELRTVKDILSSVGGDLHHQCIAKLTPVIDDLGDKDLPAKISLSIDVVNNNATLIAHLRRIPNITEVGQTTFFSRDGGQVFDATEFTATPECDFEALKDAFKYALGTSKWRGDRDPGNNRGGGRGR